MEKSKYASQNKYNKDHYFKLAIRIPKDKKDELDTLSENLGKSINSIFIEAVEAQYGIDITATQKANKIMYHGSRDSFLRRKMKMLQELGVPMLDQVQHWIQKSTDDIRDSVEYCDRVTVLANYIVNCHYDGTLRDVICE